MESTATYTVKSGEQKMLEKATETYVAQLRAAFGGQIKITVNIEKMNLSDMARIIENRMDDDEPIRMREGEWLGKPNGHHYTFPEITGDGYEIEQLSQ